MLTSIDSFSLEDVNENLSKSIFQYIFVDIFLLLAPFALKFIIDASINVAPAAPGALIVIGLVIGYVVALFVATLFDELK
jgi:hypothetical protein